MKNKLCSRFYFLLEFQFKEKGVRWKPREFNEIWHTSIHPIFTLSFYRFVHKKLNVVEILKETSYFIESKQKIVKWRSLKANLYHTFWLCVRSNWKGTKNEYREPLNFFLLNCVFEGRINQRDHKGRRE